MKKIILIFTALVLNACAMGAIDYQKANDSSIRLDRGLGYEDSKIKSNVYRVKFQGNAYNSSIDVYNFFLRRCAEITLRDGFDAFVLSDNRADRITVGNFAATVQAPYYEGTATLIKGEAQNAINAKEILERKASK